MAHFKLQHSDTANAHTRFARIPLALSATLWLWRAYAGRWSICKITHAARRECVCVCVPCVPGAATKLVWSVTAPLAEVKAKRRCCGPRAWMKTHAHANKSHIPAVCFVCSHTMDTHTQIRTLVRTVKRV